MALGNVVMSKRTDLASPEIRGRLFDISDALGVPVSAFYEPGIASSTPCGAGEAAEFTLLTLVGVQLSGSTPAARRRFAQALRTLLETEPA